MKRLLIYTQVVDRTHPVLGFFHTWIQELSPYFASITVVCLENGEYELPQNIRVYSLGKEEGGVGALRYILRFYQLLWKIRDTYDSVFVHMNEEYILMGAPIWRLLGIRTSMWRNFHKGTWRTRIAVAFANKVFCTSGSSYTARFKKTHILPVGVDLTLFAPVSTVARNPGSILSFGRIAPVKNIHLLIQALKEVDKRGIAFTASIYGDALPVDEAYRLQLIETVETENLSHKITFHAGIPHRDAAQIFQEHEIFVNLSPSGMYDKTIFEAAAVGTLSIASSEDYTHETNSQLVIDGKGVVPLTNTLVRVLTTPPEVKESLRGELHTLAQKHSLTNVIHRLCHEV